MKKFEYINVPLKSAVESRIGKNFDLEEYLKTSTQILNELGEKGWELVLIDQDSTYYDTGRPNCIYPCYIFKREK